MNLSKYRKIVFSLAAGILLLVGLFLVLRVPPMQASDSILYVSSKDPACGSQSPCYTTIQDAVDAASDGDVIKIATGVYTGVQTRARITQVVYLSKSLTIQGGYTTVDWNASDPDANPVTLDAQGLGRGLVISGTITATVEGLRITGGDAAGMGGGFPLGSDAGGGGYVYTATVTISNCVVYSNTASTTASGYGGGLSLTQSAATLSGNTVISNTASTASWGQGGGLYFESSTATLSGNTVISNTASTAGSGRGGGLSLTQSAATLSGNTVISNTASIASWGQGGGLYFESSTATLSGNTVQGNTAGTASSCSGGGLHFWKSSAMLSGNTVQSNTARTASSGSGDRMYVWGGDATLSSKAVVIVGEGGGLSLIGSTATLSGNTIISNTASTVLGGSGGGLYLISSAATLSGNTVQGNTASTAAGLYSGGLGGGLDIGYSVATLSGNTVQGNTASTADYGSGGGLSLIGSTATLSGNMVISNTATLNLTAVGRGGGLYIWSSSSFTLTNNLVVGNHANIEGSGLWLEGESADPTSGRLLHNTIADNQGSGQGVHVGGYTTLAFTNTIIAGHYSVGITVTTGSMAMLEASLWYNNGSQIGGGGYIFTGTINLDGDPAFVNPSAWDYHLTASSAAIDKGVIAGVTDDIDGDSRPVDGDGDGTAVVDIGADEFAWKHIYLPLVVRNY